MTRLSLLGALSCGVLSLLFLGGFPPPGEALLPAQAGAAPGDEVEAPLPTFASTRGRRGKRGGGNRRKHASVHSAAQGQNRDAQKGAGTKAAGKSSAGDSEARDKEGAVAVGEGSEVALEAKDVAEGPLGEVQFFLQKHPRLKTAKEVLFVALVLFALLRVGLRVRKKRLAKKKREEEAAAAAAAAAAKEAAEAKVGDSANAAADSGGEDKGTSPDGAEKTEKQAPPPRKPRAVDTASLIMRLRQAKAGEEGDKVWADAAAQLFARVSVPAEAKVGALEQLMLHVAMQEREGHTENQEASLKQVVNSVAPVKKALEAVKVLADTHSVDRLVLLVEQEGSLQGDALRKKDLIAHRLQGMREAQTRFLECLDPVSLMFDFVKSGILADTAKEYEKVVAVHSASRLLLHRLEGLLNKARLVLALLPPELDAESQAPSPPPNAPPPFDSQGYPQGFARDTLGLYRIYGAEVSQAILQLHAVTKYVKQQAADNEASRGHFDQCDGSVQELRSLLEEFGPTDRFGARGAQESVRLFLLALQSGELSLLQSPFAQVDGGRLPAVDALLRLAEHEVDVDEAEVEARLAETAESTEGRGGMRQVDNFSILMQHQAPKKHA